jgi:hypothetical protein
LVDKNEIPKRTEGERERRGGGPNRDGRGGGKKKRVHKWYITTYEYTHAHCLVMSAVHKLKP